MLYLDGELLKQKLQTKNYQIIEKQINIFIYFKLLQTYIFKTTRFTTLFLLVRLTCGDIQQLVKCKSVALFKNYHYCNSLPITILQFITSLKLLFNIEKNDKKNQWSMTLLNNVTTNSFSVQCSMFIVRADASGTEIILCTLIAVQLDLRTVTHRNSSCSSIK